jgi:hypothetical protein
MPIDHKIYLINISSIIFLFSGVILIVLSAVYVSSFLAVLGLAVCFWAGVFLYIAPTKHIPLTLLNFSLKTNWNNIERILAESAFSSKAIYLPPKNLKSADLDLVLIPKSLSARLPEPNENQDKLFSRDKQAVFITPPGEFLAQFIEQELKTSFTKTNLTSMQNVLPRLIEDLGFAESMEIIVNDNCVSVEIKGHIFSQLCRESSDKIRTKQQVGCVLGSAIACILAKVTGKPVTIENEECNPDAKISKIIYRLWED